MTGRLEQVTIILQRFSYWVARSGIERDDFGNEETMAWHGRRNLKRSASNRAFVSSDLLAEVGS